MTEWGMSSRPAGVLAPNRRWPVYPVILVATALILVVAYVTISEDSSRRDIYNRLTESSLLAGNVPEEFEFIEVHGTRAPDPEDEDSVALVYATYDGPDDRNRLAFQIFRAASTASDAFQQIMSPGLSAEVLDSEQAEKTSATCLGREGLGADCSALVQNVIVTSESLVTRGDAVEGNQEHA